MSAVIQPGCFIERNVVQIFLRTVLRRQVKTQVIVSWQIVEEEISSGG
jgi:hypothetical protein